MNTANWESFFYKTLFEIKKGKRLTKADMIEGSIPYVGATDSNNGITAFISNDRWLHEPNTISVSYNGSIAEAFYQDVAFWATDDVNVLYPKFELNRNRAIFLTTLINKEKFRYNYGRKWDKEVMENSIIKLPADKEGMPDWNWIDDYVADVVVPNLPSMAASIWNNAFNTNSLANKKIELDVSKWQWFEIGNILPTIYKAVAHNAQDLIVTSNTSVDNVPHVTRTDANNGVKDFVRLEATFKKEQGNAITIGDTTATIFYQEREFICGDHMVILRSQKLNKYNSLFLTTIMNLERPRYNYGRAFKKDTIAATKIKLPAIDTGKKDESGRAIYEADWQFMEDYIKSLPYSACL